MIMGDFQVILHVLGDLNIHTTFQICLVMRLAIFVRAQHAQCGSYISVDHIDN